MVQVAGTGSGHRCRPGEHRGGTQARGLWRQARAEPRGRGARSGNRQAGRFFRGGRARRSQFAPDPAGDPGDGQAVGGAGRRRRRRGAAEQGGGRGQRHPDRRRRSADDGPRALLQAGAARCDRRLRHARQGHHHPSPELRPTWCGCGSRAGAPDQRRLGHAARRSLPGRRRSSRRWTARRCCATSRKFFRARRSTSPRSTRCRATFRRACRSRSRCARGGGARAKGGNRGERRREKKEGRRSRR